MVELVCVMILKFLGAHVNSLSVYREFLQKQVPQLRDQFPDLEIKECVRNNAHPHIVGMSLSHLQHFHGLIYFSGLPVFSQ